MSECEQYKSETEFGCLLVWQEARRRRSCRRGVARSYALARARVSSYSTQTRHAHKLSRMSAYDSITVCGAARLFAMCTREQARAAQSSRARVCLRAPPRSSSCCVLCCVFVVYAWNWIRDERRCASRVLDFIPFSHTAHNALAAS